MSKLEALGTEPVVTDEVVDVEPVADESVRQPMSWKRRAMWALGIVGFGGTAAAVADPEGAANLVQQAGDYVVHFGQWAIGKAFEPLFDNPMVGPTPQDGGPVM